MSADFCRIRYKAVHWGVQSKPPRQRQRCVALLLAETLAHSALAGAVGGCSAADRPPALADGPIAAQTARPQAPAGAGGAAPSAVPTTGACASATAELDVQRANLYFLLDVSASMGEPIEAADSSATRYQALTQAVGQVLRRVGHRVNYGASVFPVGDLGCGPGRELLPLTAGEARPKSPEHTGPLLGRLLTALNRFVPEGATPTAAALSAVHRHLSRAAGSKYLFLVTDGAPNCNAQARCEVDACMPNLEGWIWSTEEVCGPKFDCCAPQLFGPTACLDEDGSLAAIEELADANVTTLVIGIPGSERYADTLQRLAQAGGAPNQGPIAYYSVSDAEGLVSTITELGTRASLSCELTLGESPPDPSLVNVYVDGTPLPGGPTGDWAWRDAATVEVLGEACQRLKRGEVQQLQVVAGCPVVLR